MSFPNKLIPLKKILQEIRRPFDCKLFCYHDLVKCMKPLDLNIKPAILLVVMKKLIEISFIYNYPDQLYDNNKYEDQEQRIDTIFKYLRYFQINFLFSDYYSEIGVNSTLLIIVFVLNCLILLFLAIKYICYIYKYDYKLVYFYKTIRTFITLYNYGFSLISLGVSTQIIDTKLNDDEQYKQAISYINIISTLFIGKQLQFIIQLNKQFRSQYSVDLILYQFINKFKVQLVFLLENMLQINFLNNQIIGFIIEFHDFSFSFNHQSCLLKPTGLSNLLIFILSICLVFLNKFTSLSVCSFYGVLFFGVSSVITYYQDQFFSLTINCINFSINMSQFLISLCVALQIIFKHNADTVLVCALTLPIIITIAIKIKINYSIFCLESFFTEDNIFDYSPNKFFTIIRSVLMQAKNCQNHYMFNGQGIIFENVMHLHRISCKNNNINCFCSITQQSKNSQNTVQIQELTEQHKRAELIQIVLLEFIQDYIKSAENNKNDEDVILLKFNLIHYLHEIIKDPTKTSVELFKFFEQNIKKALKVKGAYLFYFQQLKDSIIESYQDFFVDSQIVNQRINMMGAILFDEKLQQCKEMLSSQIYSTGLFYDYLCSDYLNLQTIQSQSKILQKNKQQLEKMFTGLYEINPFNIDLQYITSIYIQTLDIENRKISDFQKSVYHNQNLTKKGLKQIQQQYTNSKSDFFSDKSCVIYSSLVEAEYKIKKVSIQFQKLFKIEIENIVGKSINVLLPRIVRSIHDQMIENFANKDSMNIISQGIILFQLFIELTKYLKFLGEKQAFAIDNKGFIFPITFRLKLESSLNDIGICALIQKGQQSKSYILFNDEGKITDFSKKIYYDLFQTLDYKKGFFQDISFLIPAVQNIIEENLFDISYCSPLIVPKNLNGEFDNKTIAPSSIAKKPISKLYTFKDEIFLVQFKVCRIQTKIDYNINYIEIDFIEKESHELKKKKIISELNKATISISTFNYTSNQTKNYFNQNIFSEKQISQQNIEFSDKKKRNNDAETNFEDEQINSNNSLKKQRYQRKEKKMFATPTLIIQQQQQNDIISNIIYSPHKNDTQRMIEMFVDGGSNTNQDINTPTHINSPLYIKSLNQINDNYQCDNKNSTTNMQNPIQIQGNEFSKQINMSNMNYNQMMNETGLSNNYMNSYSISRYPLYKNQEDLTPNSNINQQQQVNYEYYPYIQEENSLNNIDLNRINQNDGYNQIKDFYLKSQFQIQSNNENLSCEFNQMENELFPQNKKRNNSDISSSDEDVEDKEAKNDQRNEIASVNSSKFSSMEMNKRSIIKKIKQNNISRGQYFMLYMGVIAFTVLLLVTIFMNQKNIDCLHQYLSSFSQIDHALYLFIDILEAVSHVNFRDATSPRTYYYDELLLLYKEAEIDEQLNEVQKVQFGLTVSDYQYNFYELIYRMNDGQIQEKLYNEKFSIVKYTLIDGQNLTEEKWVEQNLQYTIMEFYYAIIQYTIEFSTADENFIWFNIPTIKIQMKNLQQIVQNVALIQFSNMEDVQKTILLIISIINTLLVITIIPLSVQLQYQKEKILKLVGSFQPQILERQVQIIEYGLLKLEQLEIGDGTYYQNKSLEIKSFKHSQRSFQKLKQLKPINDKNEELKQLQRQQTSQSGNTPKQKQIQTQFIVRLPNKRNRSIASFSSLPKFNLIIFIVSILTIFILIIQPFVNIVISETYLDEQKVLLDERIMLLDISSQIIDNKAPHYTNIYMVFYTPDVNPMTIYYEYIKNNTESNTIQVQKIPQLQKTLEVKRFKQDRFDDFYQKMLNGNICEVKEKYPNYFKSNFTKEQCETIYGGILQRGLLLSFRKAFDTFFQMTELYEEDYYIFYDDFVKFMYENDLFKMNNFLKLIKQSVDAIRLYQNAQSEEYHLSMESQFILLFIIQIFIIAIVFVLGWTYLFKKFTSQLNETKNIFILFHINILFENNFIISYLKTSNATKFN